MTDPTITVLHPDLYPRVDIHWVRENIDSAERKLERIPQRYAGATATVPDIVQWVDRLIHDAGTTVNGAGVPRITTGPSLLVLGPVGTGKTHEAYGALRALAKSGVQCSWTMTTAADLYAALRPRPKVDAEAELETYTSAKLLVIDDLGAAKNSEWVEEINYRLINHRYEHELPTLITSNLLPRDLSGALGDRVASRLVEMTERVVLQGTDRRRGDAA